VAEKWGAFAERAIALREPRALDEVLASKRGDPVALGMALVELLRKDASLADPLLRRFPLETDEKVLFQMARVLNRFQTPDRVKRTVEALRTASPEARAMGLHALLGRQEPEAIGYAAECYLNDPDPGVQARAAFTLREVVDRCPREVIDRALEAVRSVSTTDRVKVESLDLLGAKPLTALEERAVEAAFHSSASAEVKNAALRSLVSGCGDRDLLRTLMAAVVADPQLPAEMRETTRQALESLSTAPRK
jgi:HEAT repeat protein